MPLKLINVAVIGTGYWGPNLVRNFLKLPRVRVLTACDIKEESRRKFSSNFPEIPVIADFQKILTNKKIDVVAIATPVSSHYEIAKKTLLSQKHVILEKPMTKTSQEALELIDIASGVNRQIMVGHTFVYSSAVQAIKKLIDHHDLGELFYFDSIRINTKLIRKDVNVIWDLAPHDLSIISFIFSQKPTSLQAFGSKRASFSHLEIAHIILNYPSGFTAHIHVNWLSPVKIRKILIGGSKKMIVYDSLEPTEQLRIYNENIGIDPNTLTPFSPGYRSGDILIPKIDEVEPLYTELDHFINCLRNNKKPLTDGYAGLQVVKLLEATDMSLKQNNLVKL